MDTTTAIPEIQPTAVCFGEWSKLADAIREVLHLKEPTNKGLNEKGQDAWQAKLQGWGWDASQAGNWPFVKEKLNRLRDHVVQELGPGGDTDSFQGRMEAHFAAFGITRLLQSYLLRIPHGRDEINAVLKSQPGVPMASGGTPTAEPADDSDDPDDLDDLEWERDGDPDAQIVLEMFQKGEIVYRLDDGTSSQFKLKSGSRVRSSPAKNRLKLRGVEGE